MSNSSQGRSTLSLHAGPSAITCPLLAITRLGDEIISGNNLYGGTYQLFHDTFPKLGRTVKFASGSDTLPAGNRRYSRVELCPMSLRSKRALENL